MVADDDLAGELRALAHTLHETHADEQRRTVAFDLLRQANAQLAIGERRLRWYEKGPEHVGLPTRNRELSGWSGSVNAVAPPMPCPTDQTDLTAATMLLCTGWRRR